MFALRKTTAGPGLTLVDDAPMPTVRPTDVLIAVTHAGICGTDRHIYEWDEWSRGRVRVPVTVGHEFVGRVVEVGASVQGFEVGQRVSGEGHIGCGRCEECRTGNAHICRFVEVIGIERDGTFAQYLSLPEANVWAVGEAVPDEVAAIMDPIGNAMHTVDLADVSGRDVLITGAGVIGSMAVAIARRAGARRVVAVDIDPGHLELARQMGADDVFDGRQDDWWQAARALTTDDSGYASWLEMSGAPPAIDQGFKALRNGGTVAMLGYPSKPMSVDLGASIIFKGVTVRGVSGRRMYETWFHTERFLAESSAAIARVVTHRFPVADYEEAFRTLASGDAIKVLLVFPEIGGESKGRTA